MRLSRVETHRTRSLCRPTVRLKSQENAVNTRYYTTRELPPVRRRCAREAELADTSIAAPSPVEPSEQGKLDTWLCAYSREYCWRRMFLTSCARRRYILQVRIFCEKEQTRWASRNLRSSSSPMKMS